jgi:hypothetical protein
MTALQKQTIANCKGVQNRLVSLWKLYIQNRGKGSTTLLKEGLNNYKGKKIILASERVKQNIFSDIESPTFKFNELSDYRNCAIAIDNSTMITLLDESMTAIGELLNLIDNLNKELKDK